MRWFAVLLSASLTLNVLLLTKIWQSDSDATNVLAKQNTPALKNTQPVASQEDAQEPAATAPATSNFNDISIAQLNTHWQRWQRDQDYRSAQTAIHAYLQQHPQDIDALLIEAELIAATEPLSEAIEHYYSLLSLPLSQSQDTQIRQRIITLTDEAIARLSDARAWDVLAMFVEPLVQLDPTERRYILALAQAYGQQSQFTLMENTLASLMPNDHDAQRLREALIPKSEEQIVSNRRPVAEITPKPRKQGIALTRIGDQFLVNAKLNSSGVTLLIDTGASASAITQQHFETLPRSERGTFIGRFTINTAAGQIVAPMYRMATLSIGRYSVNNTTVMILPLDDLGVADGLLGMNFLKEFDFRIDQSNALLYL
ncbi:retropepsin-like aspartic protease family protein [Aestuariibacter salexigens]|uniref:retropepsin-like aspartic protease family protein n=1 Tax=Aestuariibacter salexigens TaxID=226010 RepID=UPI0003F6FD52|nr:retropepsin-like aspartic protease [Aestuariibacter salexigens]